MPRYRRPPLSLADIWADGPSVGVRDLVAVTGLNKDTIYQDIQAGVLKAAKRTPAPTSRFRVTRSEARAWLVSMGTAPEPVAALVRTWPNLQPPTYAEQVRLLQTVLDLMGLGSIVRNAVATAHKTIGGSDGLESTITHEAWTGVNSYGKPTYGSAVHRAAFVEFTSMTGRPMMIRTQQGQDLLVRARVMLLVPFKANGADGRLEPLDPRDRLTLPDGSVAPILSVGAPVDPSTELPFFLEVLVG